MVTLYVWPWPKVEGSSSLRGERLRALDGALRAARYPLVLPELHASSKCATRRGHVLVESGCVVVLDDPVPVAGVE